MVWYLMSFTWDLFMLTLCCHGQVEKKSEETHDLIDRIANHPILQLLHLRRRSRHSNSNNNNNNNGVFRTRSVGGATATVVPSTSSDPKFQVRVQYYSTLYHCYIIVISVAQYDSY